MKISNDEDQSEPKPNKLQQNPYFQRTKPD